MSHVSPRQGRQVHHGSMQMRRDYKNNQPRTALQATEDHGPRATEALLGVPWVAMFITRAAEA